MVVGADSAARFGVFCLVTRSWTPLVVGWPLVATLLALAHQRQRAAIYEQRNRRRYTPHA